MIFALYDLYMNVSYIEGWYGMARYFFQGLIGGLMWNFTFKDPIDDLTF